MRGGRGRGREGEGGDGRGSGNGSRDRGRDFSAYTHSVDVEAWQRDVWAQMDAEESEEYEERVDWAVGDETRAAWERHRAVQAEMRRYGVL